jgi:high-affinity nickel-transport protein
MDVAWITSLAFLGSALLLGIRHGIDWDHIAAIADIAGTTTAVGVAGANGGSSGQLVQRRLPLPSVELNAIWLSLLYALGHASVVALLGFGALAFAAILPDWIDPIMERVVGVTLLALGFWVIYSLVQYARGRGEFRLQSRWMLVFAAARHGWNHAVARIMRRQPHAHSHVDRYGPRTAFSVGMIHGIGAETGTQVLIIAAVGGAASQGIGIAMMLAFIIGLVISNTMIAILAATGFISSSKAKPFYLAIGVLTAIFSLVIGTFFTLGIGAELPDLGEVFSFIGSDPA